MIRVVHLNCDFGSDSILYGVGEVDLYKNMKILFQISKMHVMYASGTQK